MMNRIWSKNLILSIFLLVLGFATYWLEFKKKPETEKFDSAQKKVFQEFEYKTIKSLEIQSDGELFVMKCNQGCAPGESPEFQMTAPIETETDLSHVGSLISSIKTAITKATVDLNEESKEQKAELLESYGLTQAMVSKNKVRKLKVTYQDGSSESAYFGSVHPINRHLYVMRAKNDKPVVDQVELFAASFDKIFRSDLKYWRNKRVIHGKAKDYLAFRLENEKGKTSLKLNPSKQWIVNEKHQADRADIDSFLSGIVFIVAKSFYPDRKILQGTKKVSTVFLSSKDESTKEIELEFFLRSKQGRAENLYAKSSLKEEVFEIEKNLIDTLKKGKNDLRTKRLLSVRDQILARQFEFSGSTLENKTVSIKKEKAVWKTSNGNPAHQKNLNIFLDKISDKMIKQFVSKKMKPQGETLTVSIGSANIPKQYEYTFWREGNKLFALDLKSSINETILLKPDLLKSLPWKLEFFKPKDKKVSQK